ncbi:succinate dehydrogenase, hydrophobic membrane anchor protein [Prosthecomicrobium hirschii]|uniref:Succinate dehydrogenase hydrophobic membrane anchor subunit n=1 Tax=Prosthecodimorpha hirschii TaxID=665126 RepID=A0A0P6WGC1_9HYPH|nr:succinate dehydrogenase, hydrophobic membrane anchor protein [Prosthecomicrobium hirschii]KPL53730.1 succinate dehydrogenase [Prosthecomicrobium hirschii]MCW1842851.1 succinate dehydrogenase, hydrophobic membrane anchor protein [Prosthecomicrobium hirschii]TPQ48844.1 succinate dehydrogenase, hydrophobic membrane anchor protein [Prosthecomicrobium hirschii]
MSMRTPLGRVRGLGSAHDGTHHFWQKRVTSVALVPLTLIVVGVVIAIPGRSHADAVALLGHPLVAITLLATLLAGIHHMHLGMQVVIEDYIHTEPTKTALVLANTFFCALMAIACVWAVVKLSFGI